MTAKTRQWIFRDTYGKRWKIEADRTQVFPDDPGLGTPLLVVAPDGGTITLACALGTGEVEDIGQDGYQSIPSDVWDWLSNTEAEAEGWVYDQAM